MAWRRGGLDHLRGGRRPDRLVVGHGATPRRAVPPRDPAAFWLWFGIGGLLTLDVPAEAEAHGRENLFAERVLLPRAEAGVERRGQHVRRDRFLDRGLDGPAALAGILDVAGEFLQLRILRQRGGAEIEQPGRDDAAAPPNLGDVRHVQREALVLGQILRVLVAQDVEALGIGLHHSVFDAVMHHLDEMPGAGRPGMNVAALGAGIAVLAARCARDVAETRERAPRRSDRDDPPPPSGRRSSCNSRARCPKRRRTCRNRHSECASRPIFSRGGCRPCRRNCRRR